MGAGVQIVENNSLRVSSDGYELGLRVNWYRSLPISCVEKLTISLDGQPVEPEVLRLEVNGRQYSLAEMEDAVEEFWFVQDTARLHVLAPGPVRPGEEHNIEVELAWRFPYIVVGPGRFLIMPSKYAAAQVASGG